MNSGSAGVTPKTKHRGIKTIGRKRKLKQLSLESYNGQDDAVDPAEVKIEKRVMVSASLLPGSESMACWILGINGNLGEPMWPQ